MNSSTILALNFEEVRRRSIMIWRGLPEEFYHWKPDHSAETLSEIIRHVLECERLFHMRILNRGPVADYVSPWEGRSFIHLNDELQFAAPYRNEFITMVRSFSPEDLNTIEVKGRGVTQTRTLGDYLLRAAYHESVHAGQFLAHLRTLKLDRPYVWD
jgi:uncharacterized damage-inducible protein DinB